ncbi:porin [Yersinia aleksiciae]|uniref:Membrane protein n=2 Tax=Yersinia aleksiciae TaxID=263819 RepID=A0A0T9UY23_YERAE|nr:porin [Yersinia aleksiciae]AKP33049.1 membrane protein [Yersinia aleksiciae]CFQ56296.1 porin [Yersinia aleksiciae]CNL83603.1 porin [Yersinia aleksiciae]
MKNKIIPILLLTGMSSSALAMNVYKDDETTLDIYGRLEYQFAHGDASFAGNDSRNQLGGRLGFYLTRDLSLFEDTKVIGRLEWQVRTEKNDNKTKDKDLDVRYAWLGLSHARYGELIGGRTQNPLYQVMRMTDKYKNFTPNVYNYGISSIDTSYQYNRQDGTLQWNGQFNGHQIQAAYVAGNGHGDNEALDNGMMISYRKMLKFGDLKITPAIAASEFNRKDNPQKNTTDGRKKHQQVMGGLQFDYDAVSLAITAGKLSIERDKKADNDYVSFDSVASYQFEKVKILGGYSFLDEDGQDIYEQEGWRAEAQLTLAKNTYLSLSYNKELASKNVKTNDDAVIAGLRYDF